MFNLMKIFALFASALIVGCATGLSAPSGLTFDSPVGEWSEQYETSSGNTRTGKVTIIDETRATFTNPSGRIEFYAIDDQGLWKGYWIRESGSQKCLVEKDESRYWGEQYFQFNETYNEYTGTWNFCGKGQKFNIIGVR